MANPWDNDHKLSREELGDQLARTLRTTSRQNGVHLSTDPLPTWHSEGWDCDVFLARDDGGSAWFCKLPKRRNVLPCLRKEAAVLDVLPQLGFGRVPRLGIRGRAGLLPYDWTAVSEAPGHQLLHHIVEVDLSILGSSCGEALRQIHSLSPPSTAVEAATDALHRVDTQVRGAAPALDVLSTHLDEALLRNIRKAVARTGAHQPETVAATFVHGDLFPEHVFVDLETSSVVHLIDWADTRWDDPAVDFTMLGWILGDLFLEAAIDAYRPENRDEFKRRIYRLGSMMGIHDVHIAQQGGPNVSLKLRLEVLRDRAREGWFERF